MNIKKFFAGLTALTMTVSMMSGCSGSPDNQNETKDYIASEHSETTAESTAESKTEETSAAEESSVLEGSIPADADEFKAYFSFESGFYDSPISLEIACPAYPDGKIYYTTDGSTPNESSQLYTGKIELKNRRSEPNVLAAQKGTSAGGDYIPRKNVDKANVIRAVVIMPDGSVSEISNGTFFIGQNREKKYGDVPVISLMTDMENLYDYEKGIYILGKTHDDWLAEDSGNKRLEAWQHEGNYSNRGREWERPVAFEYITADGSEGISQDLGVRIMGAASRNATQKSLRLTAREDYGLKAVNYELIPGNLRSDETGNVEKYKSFVLRNGGNDCDYAKIRDPLFHQLISDRRVETQQFTPCVVYLNGEYWGMYTLIEDYNDNYIENNYGIDNHNVVIIKCGELEEGEDADIELYNEMYDFITFNDMSVTENYAKASEMIDIGSYADYCAFNMYIYNQDSIFDGNNWRMWRVRTPNETSPAADGKWRMMVYDTDYSSGIYNGGGNYGEDNISSVIGGTVPDEAEEREPKYMFLSLFKNEDFRRELVISMCDIRNYDFDSEKAIAEMLELYNVYEKLVPATFERFGPEWLTWNTKEYYYQKINELATFIDGRYMKFPEIMQKAFGLGDIVQAEFKSTDGGSITVNNTAFENGEAVKGKYFTDYTIKVKAVPDASKAFKEWKCTGCEIIGGSTSTEIEVSFSGDFTIEAVFE
ncbi:MAG: CotH kinase family protein [Oscillospiraceae bacterium]|nr:CotH kinase family protein [Oscillospiraceae bacterium]